MDDRRPNYRDLQDNLRELGEQLEAAEALVAQEREAREKLQGEYDFLRGSHGHWQALAEAAEARCAELEAALGFYATSEPRGHWTPRIMADGGRRATEALASSLSGEETT